MEEPIELIELLRSSESFTGASESDLVDLIAGLEPRGISQGTDLVKEGEPGEFLWVLIEGTLSVLGKRDEEINQISVPGEIFGEISAVSLSNATATVRSTSDVTVLAIPHQRMHLAMKKSQILASSILRSMAKYLGRQ